MHHPLTILCTMSLVLPALHLLSLAAPNTTTKTLTASSPIHPSSANKTHQFDSISAPHITPLPLPYHHLAFRSFSAFSPHAASLAHLITPQDKNCASSTPNALLGSVQGSSGAPSIAIANASAMAAAGLQAWFDLHGFTGKPLAAPEGEGETRLRVRGWRAAADDYQNTSDDDTDAGEGGAWEDEPLEWFVDFPSEYHERLQVEMPEAWRGLGRVEMWAQFGVDGLDWEFCVDDVVLGFTYLEGRGDLARELSESKWEL